MAGERQKIAIVTVHGTGDTAPEPDGEPGGSKWFQTRSAFIGRLKDRLAGRGLDADVFAHLWSGANSASEREKGAQSLAGKIKRLSRKYRGRVHVIGHSHGGNVANDAAVILNWSEQQRRRKLSSISTVGTPFFRAHATLSDQLGAWFFALVLISGVLLIPAIAMFAGESVTSATLDAVAMPLKNPQMLEAPPEFDAAPRNDAGALAIWLGANALPLASAIALLFMLPIAFRGLGRVRRASWRQRTETALYSLWHPNDEAIAFLSRLEETPIEPFPRGSLFRGSRTGGIIWGVRTIILINLIGVILLAGDIARGVHLASDPFQAYGVYFLIVGIAGAPVVFLAAYLLFRLFAALVLELALRGALNNSIGGALKAIAFGRDSDHRIDRVAPCSHSYGARREVLEGELAKRMLDQSSAASQRLFDKYRAALFSVEADQSNAVNQLTQDAMTWDSLIHTTYFDQPEVAELIANFIAQKSQEVTADA